jgi:hypothetical protein
MSGTSGGAFLFQRVWVGHGAQGLLRVLKGSVHSEGYGRRLELPTKLVNHDTALANPIRLLDILTCYPRLQILIKPTFIRREDGGFWVQSHSL